MATALFSALPPPKRTAPRPPPEDPLLGTASRQEVKPALTKTKIPPYGSRQNFVPRKPEHFGDGGAYPEIHVAQYPLDMGRPDGPPAVGGAAGVARGGGAILPVTLDAQGKVEYDAIVKQMENSNKIVPSKHSELVPKIGTAAKEEAKPTQEDIDEVTARTKAALQTVVNTKISAAQPTTLAPKPGEPTYIKYQPSQQGAAFNSGAKQRVIRMVEAPKDPLEPPKFKHKKVPRGPGSPPVPVMHSPPRAVTVKDQQDWKIPPCISNWKNAKGYTIPLDKRLAADGRGLQEVQINDNFAKLSEALYVAEQKAREAVETRSKIQKELLMREKEKKEGELRSLAQRARMERAGALAGGGGAPAAPGGGIGGGASLADPGRQEVGYRGRMADEFEDGGGREGGMDAVPANETREEREERLKREALREERRRERERERRLAERDGGKEGGAKRSKLTRDRERDVSEKIALGQAAVGARGGEVQYDQRLFNQEKGMSSGFGAEDEYHLYDKGLFAGAHPSASGLYRPRKDVDGDTYGGGDRGEEERGTGRFRPDREFAGTGRSAGPRDAPVEFEKDAEEADPFGLDQFLTEVKTGKKAMDKIGGGGTMKHAAGGGGGYGDYDGGSGRSHVDFERGRR
eukprot:jgi/Mesvir1/26990/Mv20701-RA.1